jgi:site-specific DNA recombinase
MASIALYARVSSEQQADAGTIRSQVSSLLEKISSDGFSLPSSELQFIDEGYSGATLIRPALERLRDSIFNGAVDCVYVHSPDRLARKYAYQILLMDEFQKGGAKIVFLNRKIGETPEDELLLQVQGMMAEYERAKILERSRRGKIQSAKRGSVNVLGALHMAINMSANMMATETPVMRSSSRKPGSFNRCLSGSVETDYRSGK